ncbi:hypothetical protein INS49_004250 [Diaporthe citri]|uniref:uncharacterized protein n=1 Tax=Diaporthe citri TaxID=83186 RepID=UPI001C8066F3|nr:uncharacterized protein INS49_004250 [Diaporthe citri]KAG6355169.1 hypothetical protein INS49_004250 [Diaporthe citri]
MDPDLGAPRRQAVRFTKLNKSCDQCRHRKVRCISLAAPTSSGLGPASAENHEQLAHGLLVDRLLEDPSSEAVLYDEFSILKAHGRRATSSGLAFFSERKVELLTRKIGNSRLRDLIVGIDTALRSGLLTQTDTEISQSLLLSGLRSVQVSPDEAAIYINENFHGTHPVFPFLDRKSFEQKVRHIGLASTSNTSPQFLALYHAVLSLGCQYHEGGSLEPGKGKACDLFLVAMSHVSDNKHLGDSLVSLQALTAMSIFALNPCCLLVDRTILAEAIQMALRLRYHTSTIDENQEECRRTFWVLYHLEKHDSFQARRALIISDHDIGCPVPQVTSSSTGEYNWFLSSIRLARILSVAYETLFSVSASTCPAASQLMALHNVRTSPEKWRMLVPVEFRPPEPLNSTRLVDPRTKHIALSTQYYYYHLVIAVKRLSLRLGSDQGVLPQECHTRLMQAAKTVIELTRFIDVEPNTPIFILGIMPLSSLFILFDFIVQNPHHTDTRSRLTLLDIASGHFSQLELVSAGSLPGNHLSEFAHIARRYVQELPAPAPSAAGSCTEQPTTTPGVTQPDASLEVGTTRDTGARTYEVTSSGGGMDDLGSGTVFDASMCFDDF